MLLNIMIWLPVIGAILALCGQADRDRAVFARAAALIVTIICALLSILLYLNFDLRTQACNYYAQAIGYRFWVSIMD